MNLTSFARGPAETPTVDGRSYVVAAANGTPIEEHLSQACARLAAAFEPGFRHCWSVRRIEIPAGDLGPARTIWLGCANFASGAAVFVARDSYDVASRALLGELLLTEGA